MADERDQNQNGRGREDHDEPTGQVELTENREHNDSDGQTPAVTADGVPQAGAGEVDRQAPVEISAGGQDHGNDSQTPPEREEGTPQQIGFLELVYGILFEPRRTMESIAQNPPVGLALLTYAIVTLISFFAGFLALQGESFNLSGEFETGFSGFDLGNISGFSLTTIIIFFLFMGFLALFVYSGYLHLVGEFLGGRGSAVGVFAFVCLSRLPYIFTVPVNIVAPFLNTVGTVLIAVTGIVVFVWGLIIQKIGLEKTLTLSSGRSLLAVISPFMLGLLFIVMFIVLIIVIAASIGGSAIWD